LYGTARRTLALAMLAGCTGPSVQQSRDDYCRGAFSVARTGADSALVARRWVGNGWDGQTCAEYLGRQLRQKAGAP
jgi:hypothetical protein